MNGVALGLAVASFAAAEAAEAGREVRGRRSVRARVGRLALAVRVLPVCLLAGRVLAVRVLALRVLAARLPAVRVLAVRLPAVCVPAVRLLAGRTLTCRVLGTQGLQASGQLLGA